MLLRCAVHGVSQGGPWVVCVHEDKIREARRHPVPIDHVVGEALCDDCRRLCDQRQAPEEDLRIACAPCVLARWPLVGGN